MSLNRFRGMGLGLLLLASCRRAAPPQPVSEAAHDDQVRAPLATKAPELARSSGQTCTSWENLDPASLSPAPDTMHARVFDVIWDRLRIRHFDPTLNCLDWPGLRDQYLAKLKEVDDSEAAYELYNALLSKLEQSHLAAVAPSPLIPQVDPKNRGPARAQVHWHWLGEKLYLREARPQEFEPLKVHRSGQIKRIDGVSVKELFALESAEGVHNAMQRAQRTERAMSCPKKGTKRLVLAKPGRPDVVVKVPCILSSPERVALGKLRDIETQVRAELLDNKAKVGYLAFNIWMIPMLPAIGNAMEKLRAQGMQSLILDLRGNRGGVASMTIPVARLLMPEGGSLGTIFLRSFRQELSVRPNPKAFAGKIVLLLDDQSASTTEIFALGLAAAKRATIVAASPSAGMALASIIEGLPDGGLLQYVIGRYQSPASKVAEGRGVAPDRLVPYREADLLARRDPVLDAALAELGSKVVTPFSR